MATWRYSVGTQGDVLKRYEAAVDSLEQGLAGLDGFLRERKNAFAEQLQWVALEVSIGDADWDSDHADWMQVRRLDA